MIALAHKVESRPVNIGLLEEYLPEVPIEDQVQVGLGWDSQWQQGAKKRVWGTFMMGSQCSDDHPRDHHHRFTILAASALPNGLHNGVKENSQNGTMTTSATPVVVVSTTKDDAENESENELEEWEIEAERRFQDSDVDDAPSLSSPASSNRSSRSSSSSSSSSSSGSINNGNGNSSKDPVTPKAAVAAAEPVMKKTSPVLEKAVPAQSRDQDQVKRRRKMWPRK